MAPEGHDAFARDPRAEAYSSTVANKIIERKYLKQSLPFLKGKDHCAAGVPGRLRNAAL